MGIESGIVTCGFDVGLSVGVSLSFSNDWVVGYIGGGGSIGVGAAPLIASPSVTAEFGTVRFLNNEKVGQPKNAFQIAGSIARVVPQILFH